MISVMPESTASMSRGAAAAGRSHESRGAGPHRQATGVKRSGLRFPRTGALEARRGTAAPNSEMGHIRRVIENNPLEACNNAVRAIHISVQRYAGIGEIGKMSPRNRRFGYVVATNTTILRRARPRAREPPPPAQARLPDAQTPRVNCCSRPREFRSGWYRASSWTVASCRAACGFQQLPASPGATSSCCSRCLPEPPSCRISCP